MLMACSNRSMVSHGLRSVRVFELDTNKLGEDELWSRIRCVLLLLRLDNHSPPSQLAFSLRLLSQPRNSIAYQRCNSGCIIVCACCENKPNGAVFWVVSPRNPSGYLNPTARFSFLTGWDLSLPTPKHCLLSHRILR